MKFTTSLSAIAALKAVTASPIEPPSSPPTFPQDPDQQHIQRIPTSYESAVLGRRILALSPLATLSTVFPSTSSSTGAHAPDPNEDADGLPRAALLENRPPNLGGVPIGMMDYIADCGAEEEGNPTILAIKIATSFKNVAAGSNMSIGINWVPPYPPSKRIKSSSSSSSQNPLSRLARWWLRWSGDEDEDADALLPPHYDPVPYSAANLPRFSLLGHLEDISSSSGADVAALQDCFVKAHPDAKYWLPGNRIHESGWVRLVVDQVYWVGGFGDRAYIGWIPVEQWRNVTREEWEGVRLPGEEKHWKEWGVDEL
ncbi:hypothetical protein J7T55_011823 [Diaporthe amygdali]|uniref:uncharacterized protein n=1 Tax=Phomopsis amygdali TaxID=1214568 RepID=UPI0022FDC8BC|nr:uncharacterized protein J7T55_011823 [Diaporthe amygdali]KAJ0123358.1 hypothetical protein J7T55_011823 [Diaporthe amygdali]